MSVLLQIFIHHAVQLHTTRPQQWQVYSVHMHLIQNNEVSEVTLPVSRVAMTESISATFDSDIDRENGAAQQYSISFEARFFSYHF
jgi:hypothetical protein